VPDGSTKFSLILREPNTFVPRTTLSPSAIPDVLRKGCGSKVGLSVVQTVMIDMVNDHKPWMRDNLSVHLNIKPLFVYPDFGMSAGIEGAFALDGIPFVLI